MFLRNQAGFSLLESMIALAVAGIGIFAVAELTQISSKSTRSVAGRSDFDTLINTTKILLSDPKACTLNLSTIPGSSLLEDAVHPSPLPLMNLHGMDTGGNLGSVIADFSKPYGSLNVLAFYFDVGNFVNVLAWDASGKPIKYLGALVVNTSLTNAYGSPNIMTSLPVALDADPPSAGKILIKGCALKTNPSSAWTCPPGQVAQGLDASGNPVCVSAGGGGPSGQNCPSGQFVSGFDSSGNVICTPSGGGGGSQCTYNGNNYSNGSVRDAGSSCACTYCVGGCCGTGYPNCQKEVYTCNSGTWTHGCASCP